MLDQDLEIASATEGHGIRRVRIDPAGIWISGRLCIPREKIARIRIEVVERDELWIFRDEDGRTPVCTLTFRQRSACHEAVRALGRSPDRVFIGTAAGVPLVPVGWSSSRLIYPIVFFVLAICMALPQVGIAIFLPYCLLTALAAFGRRIDVGVDGVLVTLLFGRERIAYAELETVERSEDAVIFRYQDGRARRVGPFTSEQGAMLITCIMQRLVRYREPYDAVLPIAGDTVYRVAATVDDDLWRLIENPAALPSARCRAVNELAEPRDHERLRIAVEAATDPEVVSDLRARRAHR